MNIRLEPTTRENWQEALQLQVGEGQEQFVPTVAVSLAKVHVRPDGDEYEYWPMCLYNEKDELVGFVMLTFDENTDWSYWMNGFLVDRRFQGKGYGRAAMEAVIAYIKERFPQSKCMNLTVCAENTIARRLYASCGFAETGDVYDGEIVYRRAF